MGRLPEPDCTSGCCSRLHGSLITAAIIRGTEAQAIAYMKNLCHRCCFVMDETGKTALHTAASCGRRKVVKWLLSQGVPLNQRDWESGYTPLHRALFYGQIHVACALIQAGGSISTLDHDALSPLDHINFDRPSIVSFTSSLPTNVYVWGSNTNYNLGQTNQHARGTPECLESLHREGQVITDVVLSKFHTLFLVNTGRVYTCGYGQGGRLGLDTSVPVITPHPIKAFMHINITKVAVGPDHSLFLSDSGQVWSTGTNVYHQLGINPPPEHVYTPRLLTWHKSHKEVIAGVAAAKYHSVIWTSRTIYTFGLNAGQLGHFKNSNERTIISPRNVTSVVLREDGNLASIGVSDGATVLSTSHGDIYVLHQYQIRKVASKMFGVVKVACVGGHLDSRVRACGLKERGGVDLKIAVLTGSGIGHLYLWTEQSSHLSRCLFSINREISIMDFCLSRHNLGIVTDNGEAFSAVILPAQERKTPEKAPIRKSWSSSGPLNDFLDRSTCITLRLTRIAALHRTVSIMCDPEGLNFAALQNNPNSFLLDIPQVSHSSWKEDFKHLLEEVNEMDTLHDVVIVCGTRRFPAHSYILACHSGYFHHNLLDEKDSLEDNGLDTHKNSQKRKLVLSDIQPDIFQEVLTYIYTGSCQLTRIGQSEYGLTQNKIMDNVFGNTPDPELFEWAYSGNLHQTSNNSVSHKEAQHLKASNKQKKNKGRKFSGVRKTSSDLLHLAKSVAKKLQITSLEKELDGLRIIDGYIRVKADGQEKDVESYEEEQKYSRERNPELWDVMFHSRNGDILGAHKCILSARLEYFHCMFGASWMEASASESLSMPLPTSILVIILDYLYEDDSPKLHHCRNPEFVCNVMRAADQFLITRLREVCENVLSGLVTLKNAAELLEFAASYNAFNLKTTVMQYICLNLAVMLENGSLLCISNSDLLEELSDYYRGFIPRMSCRMMTPHDHPPYSDELEKLLEAKPFFLPESEEDWEDISAVKGDKLFSSGGIGSARKKKRQHRNSQGDIRSRKTSTSSPASASSSDCEPSDDLKEDFSLDFDDLEERTPQEYSDSKSNAETFNSALGLIVHPSEVKKFVPQIQLMPDCGSWQKVCKKKGTSGQFTMTSEKFSRKSSVQENVISDIALNHVSSYKVNSHDLETQERISLPNFPSLQDSLCVAQKTNQLPKKSKMGKFSQKQHKKLAAEAAAVAESAPLEVTEKLRQSSSRNTSAPVWGTNKECSDTGGITSNSLTLADIIKVEEAKMKDKSSKKSPGVGTPTSRGFSWGRRGTPPGSPGSMEKDGNGMWSLVASSPPVSPMDSNLPSPGLSYFKKCAVQSTALPPEMPSFSNILLEEEIHSENLMRERSKPLAMIQLEDQAIEELLNFYGAAECFEEKITVTRVRTNVANPTWSK